MARLRHQRIRLGETAGQGVKKSGAVIIEAAGGGFEALAGGQAETVGGTVNKQ